MSRKRLLIVSLLLSSVACYAAKCLSCGRNLAFAEKDKVCNICMIRRALSKSDTNTADEDDDSGLRAVDKIQAVDFVKEFLRSGGRKEFLAPTLRTEAALSDGCWKEVSPELKNGDYILHWPKDEDCTSKHTVVYVQPDLDEAYGFLVSNIAGRGVYIIGCVKCTDGDWLFYSFKKGRFIQLR